jgi:hypothetical protein
MVDDFERILVCAAKIGEIDLRIQVLGTFNR